MTDSQKKEIQAELIQYIGKFDSQAKAVNTLKDVSEATVINIKNSKWESISAEMWRKVGKQVGWTAQGNGWVMAETLNFTTMITFFADAKDYSNVYGIVGAAGLGKTDTAEWFTSKRTGVIYLLCTEYWNRKQFLIKLLEKMGVNGTGYNTSDLMDLIVAELLKKDAPVIILDEGDKPKDEVLYFFITLYNLTRGKCGIVLMGTPYLKARILRGVRLGKKGYSEILSRIGGKFIELKDTNREDVHDICHANGVTDPLAITEIYNEFGGDLRRVARLIHKHNRKNGK